MNEKSLMMHKEVVERLRFMGNVDDHALIDTIDEVVLACCRGQEDSLNRKLTYRKEIFDAIRGLDIMENLMEDPSITEIMVNGYQDIFIEKDGRILRYQNRFVSEEKLKDIIQKIVSGANRIVNETSPVVDARLADGSRINVVLPPVSLVGPVLTIRKFPRKYTMADLVDTGALSKECADWLKNLVRRKYNIFISGGTGTGKTTMLNALSGYIPKSERIITIEDSAELQLDHPNLVRLEARERNLEGLNEVSIRMLIRTALRMRPDRIIVGEVRSEEALDMLQAMNTGHDGSISTGHGNSTADMLSRLQTMLLMSVDMPLDAIKSQIASAIDVMIHLRRMEDGSRKIVEIVEITGYINGEIRMNPIFLLNESNNELEQVGELEKKK